MAYTCVRVHFEIGHEASIRNKQTSDGFTHDWEVFVRGVDNAEILHFVDKVVFHLHQTFPKPKRVVKEPPYVLKESGYAGFNLPIDIFFRTKDENCRRLRFFYELNLQPITGSPTISKVVREKADFFNPIEDFRRKLIKGGGVGVGSDGSTTLSDKSSSHSTSNNVSSSLNSSSNRLDDSKSSPHSSSKVKSNSGGSDVSSKKHKAPKEVKTEESNTFTGLFGAPIKPVKHSPNPKPPTKPSADLKSHDKSTKDNSSKVPKHSPAKEKEKSDKERERRDKESDSKSTKDKDRVKDKDSHRDGEKSKEKSKKSGSSFFQQKDFIKKDEVKKQPEEPVSIKERDKSSLKGETSKSEKEKKHDDKKNREDKDRKEKHKKDIHESKKEAKEKPLEKKQEVPKEPKDVGGKHLKVEKEEKKGKFIEKTKEKINIETEKPRHKHKKKDKHRKDEEKEKTKKKEKNHKEPPVPEVIKKVPPPTLVVVKEKPTPPPSPPSTKPTNNPLNQLLAELSDKDTDSDFSGSEDIVKSEPIRHSPSPLPEPVPVLPPTPPPIKIKEEKKNDIVVKEEKPKKKDKKGKDEERESRKRKRKHRERDTSREPQEKASKVSDVLVKEEKPSPSRLSVDRSRSPSPEETLFTEDYINQLKDLQHKIMTLQDNADLQKVVQVISETGQFEITQRTFDFDLCALDPSTVKMLQDMFLSA